MTLHDRLRKLTDEQLLNYYIKKIKHARLDIGRTIRNGFYPMTLFDCVEERKDDRYCGECRIFAMCRAIGWLVYIFNAQYLQQYPDDGIQEHIIGLLDAYRTKLEREKATRIGERSRTTKLRIERGLPKKVDVKTLTDLKNAL